MAAYIPPHIEEKIQDAEIYARRMVEEFERTRRWGVGARAFERKQVRCKCGARRRGVWNVGLSADRLQEIAEKERLEIERMRDISNQM